MLATFINVFFTDAYGTTLWAEDLPMQLVFEKNDTEII